MSTVLVVFRKEMTDNLRDRRSIAMAMIYPLIGLRWLGRGSGTTAAPGVSERSDGP